MPAAGAAKSRKQLRGQVCRRPLAKGDLVMVPGASWEKCQVGLSEPRCWASFVGRSEKGIRVRPLSVAGIPGKEITVADVELLDDIVTREALAALAAQKGARPRPERAPAPRSHKRKAKPAATPPAPAKPAAAQKKKSAKKAEPAAAPAKKKAPKRKKQGNGR